MSNEKDKNSRRRQSRKLRIRKKVSGTALRPRVSVCFTGRSISAQIIDDETGKTVVSATTLEKSAGVKGKNLESAVAIGSLLADKAEKAGIKSVVFDRNGYRYHGKVKSLADALREKGLLA